MFLSYYINLEVIMTTRQLYVMLQKIKPIIPPAIFVGTLYFSGTITYLNNQRKLVNVEKSYSRCAERCDYRLNDLDDKAKCYYHCNDLFDTQLKEILEPRN